MSVVDGFRVALTLGATANLSSYYVLPAGGTQPRQLQALFADWINVKSFGAVGDGATDDTAAIQAAIYAGVNKVVWFPPGIYKVGSLLLTQNCTLVGSGAFATYLLCRENNITIFRYTATAPSVRFEIRGMTLLCVSTTGCTGINLDGGTSAFRCSSIRLSDIGLEGSFDYGIKLRYCANAYLNNIFGAYPTDCFYLDNCGDIDLYGCRANLGTGYGFYIIGGPGAFDEGIRMTNCATNTQAYGIRIDGQEWGTAASCSWTTCPNGALIVDNSAAWKFSSCEFSVAGATPGNTAVVLGSGTTRFAFAGCQFSNSTYGISMGGAYHQLGNSMFVANSLGDILLPNTQSSTIFGNNCDSNGAGVPNSILETGTANYNAVTGNSCRLAVTLVGAGSLSTGNINY